MFVFLLFTQLNLVLLYYCQLKFTAPSVRGAPPLGLTYTTAYNLPTCPHLQPMLAPHLTTPLPHLPIVPASKLPLPPASTPTLASPPNLPLFTRFQKKARGIDLFNVICEDLNLLEKDYFALSFLDKHDIKVCRPPLSLTLSLSPTSLHQIPHFLPLIYSNIDLVNYQLSPIIYILQ